MIINNRKVHDLRGNLDRHELKSNEDIQYELKVVGLSLFLTFNCTSKYYLIAIIYILKNFVTYCYSRGQVVNYATANIFPRVKVKSPIKNILLEHLQNLIPDFLN